jgi:hypothetical protein
MATRKATPKVGSPLTIALRKLGCTYCAACRAFMYPDHTQHVAGVAIDLHASRYVVVGGSGHARLVDLHADAA